ncbi:MAG: hypothetical protein CMK74_20330 [Pseudomonadales bacterium]|nr:hypothetical protein [Pseudomonadales bacterium]|tara:strand:+ start:351 stop:1499 length:1149 start_codon:yes stop_codon:yes gene_type:complete
MPVTITPTGTTLDIQIVDDNFGNVLTLLKEQITEADLKNRFDRWRLSRWVSGLLVAHDTFANPMRNRASGGTQGVIDIFDLTFRESVEDSGDALAVRDKEWTAGAERQMMEFLGRPGPSMTYTFQEKGYQAPNVVSPGITGWPPSHWPDSRYPREYCFSRWLTVPGASVRLYVPERCKVQLKGHAKGSLTAWSIMKSFANSVNPWDTQPARNSNFLSVALVVDTNPELHADEFPNGNRWILDPVTGAQAARKSWVIPKVGTFRMAQREKFDIWAEQTLQGRRHYNFSLKFRAPGYFGWIDHTNNVWKDEVWETRGADYPAIANAPRMSAVGLVGSPSFADAKWVNMWESAGLSLEFDYGRGPTHLSSTDHPDFDLVYETILS